MLLYVRILNIWCIFCPVITIRNQQHGRGAARAAILHVISLKSCSYGLACRFHKYIRQRNELKPVQQEPKQHTVINRCKQKKFVYLRPMHLSYQFFSGSAPLKAGSQFREYCSMFVISGIRDVHVSIRIRQVCP